MSQLIGVIVAGFAAIVGFITYRNSREAKANEIWISYLKLAFENPNLTVDDFSKITDKTIREKYEWFIAIMFFAAEQIKVTSKKNDIWDRVIIDQIKYYGEYVFGFGQIYQNHYTPEVRNLLKVAAEELKAEGKLSEWGISNPILGGN